MTKDSRAVANLVLRLDGPTELSFDDLYTWVIWQFPRKLRDGHFGAVRPPLANHHWLPAVIMPETEKVIVYGQLDQEFASPSAAATWLEGNRGSGD